MEIRLAAELQPDSIVDGPGIRTVLWTQGCPHHCKGCHNPITHSFDDGFLKDVEELKQEIGLLEYQDGITLSGGDPLCQPEACLEIAKYCKEIGMNVWCYTGYTFEQLMALSKTKPIILDFLKYVDTLVDGKFILSEKSLDIKFRGSRNQRILDVAKSLEQKQAVVRNEYKDEPIRIGQFGIKKEEYVFI